MRFVFLLLIMLYVPVFSACTGNSAEELFRTAEFEELQNNHSHAEKLYREILAKHPESEYAAKAGQRLAELNK